MASSNIINRSVATEPRARRKAAAQPKAARGPLDYFLLGARAFASLKLTVALFAMAIVIVLVGTLAQDEMSMWTVIDHYFRSFITWIEFDVFFPQAFFPNLARVPGGIYFPGGALIGWLMATNLVAAHVMRFKIQARGTRFWSGLAIVVAGIVITWVVIASGHNPDGFQAVPIVSWATLWLGVKVCLVLSLLGTIAATYYWFRQAENRVQRLAGWGLALGAGILAALVGWIFYAGEGAMLSDSALRILWQLAKGTLAGVVLWAGCALLFKKRSGIVVLHAGIGLMMFSELFVSYAAVEERMRIAEGETASSAHDVRETELAIVDRSHPQYDQVVAVPQWMLQSGQKIQHPQLPFDIEVVEYYENSTFPERANDSASKNLATAGSGLQFAVEERPVSSGADANAQLDIAAAYVQFLDKETSQPLGTYLLSQYFSEDYLPLITESSRRELPEEVAVDGQKYDVVLRWKRTPKSYAMRLIDVRKRDYIGTDIPRDYSSDVRLEDEQRNVDRTVTIFMNNPLRYAGETFYQSSYGRLPSGREYTELQVVTNRGWMIPYVSCMIVAVGLLVHFSGTLGRFLNRQPILDRIEGEQRQGSTKGSVGGAPAKGEASVAAAPTGTLAAPLLDGPQQRSTLDWALPLFMVLLAVAWMASKAMAPRAAADEMKVHQFGHVPLVYEGRAKPYDTVARNSLRIISDLETFVHADDQKQAEKPAAFWQRKRAPKSPAIQWLLDVISHHEKAAGHRVFRIESLEVLSSFGLEPRKGLRYSFSELPIDELARQVALARAQAQKDPESLSLYQRKIIELDQKVQLYLMLSETHRLPGQMENARDQWRFIQGIASLKQQLQNPKAKPPLAVPSLVDPRQWEPLAFPAARAWLEELAEQRGVETPEALAQQLVAEDVYNAQEWEALVERRLIELTKGFVATRTTMEDDQLDRYARQLVEQLPDDTRGALTATVRGQLPAEVEREIATTVRFVMGRESLDAPENREAATMVAMLRAYRSGDEDQFNRLVADYRNMMGQETPSRIDLAKINFEAFFNRFAPFYNAGILYLVAFLLVAISWLAWSRPLSRASFWLIVFALAIHTFALVARIYISGRPPVTNLYASAVFIGWGCVVAGVILEIVFRLGIGNVIAAVAGFATLRIAHALAGDGDTFTVLQAVLDTQFWLATHVVCITLGYAATFLAGLLGLLYILRGALTTSLTPLVAKDLTRMIYGILCFAIFFSFVGTVLGGLWADDSWGRFWGWDPKENGALIIVLWNALILHARWGGMVRERGLAALAVGGNIVTAWSWFGVNELGIGLHSYGFTDGVLQALGLFVLSQLGVMALALLPTDYWRSSGNGPGEPIDAQLADT